MNPLLSRSMLLLGGQEQSHLLRCSLLAIFVHRTSIRLGVTLGAKERLEDALMIKLDYAVKLSLDDDQHLSCNADSKSNGSVRKSSGMTPALRLQVRQSHAPIAHRIQDYYSRCLCQPHTCSPRGDIYALGLLNLSASPVVVELLDDSVDIQVNPGTPDGCCPCRAM